MYIIKEVVRRLDGGKIREFGVDVDEQVWYLDNKGCVHSKNYDFLKGYKYAKTAMNAVKRYTESSLYNWIDDSHYIENKIFLVEVEIIEK